MNEHIEFSVVILAAGGSKRFGSPKQLANWQGKPLLLSTIEKIQACGIKPFVSLGANRDLILNNALLNANLDSVIEIDEWSDGLSRSIAESVCFLEGEDISGIVFLLADQPLISSEFYTSFFQLVKKSPNKLLGTAYNHSKEVVGVPAYFPRSFFTSLKELEGDKGAKEILKRNNSEVMFFEGELIDIDEPGDLVRAQLKAVLKLEKTNNSS